MGKALVGGVSPAGSTLLAVGTRFLASASGDDFAGDGGTEVQKSFKTDIGGRFSNLIGRVNAVGNSRSLTFRRNAADGNQTKSIGDGGASGIFTDAVNSDDVVPDDVFTTKAISAVSNPTYYWIGGVFSASTGHATFYASNALSAESSTNGTIYIPVCGGIGVTTSESNAQLKVRAPGTIQNMQIYVSSNSKVNNVTQNFRIGGSNGNNTVTITNSATGLFRDTTHTDAVASGDLINFSHVSTDAGLIIFQLIGATFVSSGANNDISAQNASGLARTASATVHYFFPMGSPSLSTTESLAQLRHNFIVSTSNLRINVTANTYAAAGTIRLRNGGVDVNQTISVTAGVTGWFEDSTHNDVFAAIDAVSCSIVGGTSGALIYNAVAMTEQETIIPSGYWALPMFHGRSRV